MAGIMDYRTPIGSRKNWGDDQLARGDKNFDNGNIAQGIGNKVGGAVQRMSGAGMDLAEAALDPAAASLKGAYGIGKGIVGADDNTAPAIATPAAPATTQSALSIQNSSAGGPDGDRSGNVAAAKQTDTSQIGKPTPIQYDNQGMPGGVNDTRTAMGVDTRNGGSVAMQYGDDTGKAVITGTNTAMTPAPTAPSFGVRMQNGDRVSGQGGSAPAATPILDAPVKGMGARDFSANDMAAINAGIHARVAAGGSNTFEGHGAPATPEQNIAEAARAAEGQRIAATNTQDAAVIDANNSAAEAKASIPDFSSFPPTIEGMMARKAAMQNYSMQQNQANKQAEIGIRRQEAGTQGFVAKTGAANVGSEMALRGTQGQEINQKMSQSQQLIDLQRELTTPGITPQRTAQIQGALAHIRGTKMYGTYQDSNEFGQRTGPVIGYNEFTGEGLNIPGRNQPAPAQAITRAQVDASAKAKGITDPARLQELYKTYNAK